ncbi:MAG TPA: TIM barrel protein [Bacteroidales bacterium]|nr:TIM barrel protein [Bacteroidales bacterium]
MKRRTFLKNSVAGAAGLAFTATMPGILRASVSQDLWFKISLAEWSLHRKLFAGELINMQFPAYARDNFGFTAVEYVNQFFPSVKDQYINRLKSRAEDAGVKSVLIMIDGEGDLGDLYTPKRLRSVERHYPWIDAASLLGCHAIRVNARGQGSAEQVAEAATDSLRLLCEYGKQRDISVIVENHGGYSSIGTWLTGVIGNVGMSNCGTLPDFGNFRIEGNKEYDKYKGVRELMQYAKGVSAKSHSFDSNGNEENIDYYKMINIVKKAGYTGYIDVEYEGTQLSEDEGIKATLDLLIKAGKAAE